jgi:hypothetical protein
MGQSGSAFGITLLTLAYGGIRAPEAFGYAFAAGVLLSALSVVTALFMGPEPVHFSHDAIQPSAESPSSSPVEELPVARSISRPR